MSLLELVRLEDTKAASGIELVQVRRCTDCVEGCCGSYTCGAN